MFRFSKQVSPSIRFKKKDRHWQIYFRKNSNKKRQIVVGSSVKDLQVVHLAGEASKLVVIADSEIRAIPLHHCDTLAASSCSACVGLQDPHCAWDASVNLCVAVPTRLHDSDADKMLYQNITSGKHIGCGYEQGSTLTFDTIFIVCLSPTPIANFIILRFNTLFAP